MKKTIIYTAFWLATAGIALTSCEDIFGGFLDKQPSNELTEEEVFSQWTTTREFHFDTYNFLRHGACRINNSWMDAATDLAETSYASGGTRTSFNIGNYYASGAATELTDTWEHYYRGIRKCNMLLKNIDDVPKATDDSEEAHATYVKQYKAEAHFLRAYFYWEMFLRYGPVPLVTDVLDPDGDLLSNYTTRPSLKEYVVDFILKELKDCEEGLMDKATSAESGNPGRISQPMARALYSRVMLYMASDRFRSESGISWQQAADAAQSFMTDYGTLYGLYTTDTDPKTCYTNAILKNAHDEKNNETIFWRNDVAVGWGAIYNDTPVGEGGNGGLCPSQNLVDMYDMANGQSPFSSYDETGAPVYNGTATPAINNASGYKSNDPYSNRDPRLAATVLYNGVNWGNGIINVLKGQRDNPQGNANATPTGYYTRKYIPEVILNNNHTGSNYRNWIIIRYAEILLSYAEALNNLTGPHTVELDGQPYTMSRDKEEIKKAFNQVRYRAGLPGLTANQLNSTPEVQKQIERERMVEFLWENRRFYDVRRWGIYEETEQEPIRGMNPDGATKETYYQRVIPSSSSFLTRVVDKRSVWVPIPRNEMRRLPSLDQNPGY